MFLVVGCLGEYGQGIQVPGLLEHGFHGIVHRVAVKSLLEALAPIGSQVADPSHHTVGVLVPLELGSESAPDDTDADFSARADHGPGANCPARQNELRRRNAQGCHRSLLEHIAGG